MEISSLTKEQVDRLNEWHDVMSVSPQEAMIGFMATAPHADEVEESKRLGAKYAKIQEKMLAGEKLTQEEKAFLREHYPELAAKAERMEQEAEQLKKKLQNAKSADDAQEIYLAAKMTALSELDTEDGSALFYMAAIDNAYSEHTGRKNPKHVMNILP